MTWKTFRTLCYILKARDECLYTTWFVCCEKYIGKKRLGWLDTRSFPVRTDNKTVGIFNLFSCISFIKYSLWQFYSIRLNPSSHCTTFDIFLIWKNCNCFHWFHDSIYTMPYTVVLQYQSDTCLYMFPQTVKLRALESDLGPNFDSTTY